MASEERTVGNVMIVSSNVSKKTIREAIPALYTDEWSGPIDQRMIVKIKTLGKVKYILVDDDDIHNENFAQTMPPDYEWWTQIYDDDGKRLPVPVRTVKELPSVPLRITKENGVWKYGDAPKGRKVDDDLNTNTDFLIQHYGEADKKSDALNVTSKYGIPQLTVDLNQHVKGFVHPTRNDKHIPGRVYGRGRKRTRKQKKMKR